MKHSTHLQQLFTSITRESSEVDIEKKIVIPLLYWLGYQESDWQSQGKIGLLKSDFIVQINKLRWLTPPYLIIEVKSGKKNLNHHFWQLKKYMQKTSALMGLLTNGYDFCILYNYQGQIEKIASYSQMTLRKEYHLFYKLLCHETCVNFTNVVYNNENKVRWQFLEKITTIIFKDENMLNFFNRQNSSPNIAQETQVMSEKQGTVITVFNNKGGVGKTTTTINLAATLNQLGKKVLLIDIDAQANLTTGLGIDPLKDVEDQGKKDITHLLTDPRLPLTDTIIKRKWYDIELDLIPSHIRLSAMENQLNTTVGIDQALQKKLNNHNYDFVLIDPPPAFSRVNGISLIASDAILIPTQLSAYPIRALEYVFDRIEEIEALKPLAILGIAVSMYDERSSNFNQGMVTKLLEILDKKGVNNRVELLPESTWIPRLNVLSICQQNSYPLAHAEYDEQLNNQTKQSAQKALENYRELAEYLINKTQGE
jgi:cellulose biosynthesis protein BcsQ